MVQDIDLVATNEKKNDKNSISSFLLAIATLIIGSISLVALSLTNNHFSKYVEERQEDLLNQYVYTIDLLWLNSGETWNSRNLQHYLKALENNIYFSIEDEQGNMVWELKGKNLKSAQDKLKKMP